MSKANGMPKDFEVRMIRKEDRQYGTDTIWKLVSYAMQLRPHNAEGTGEWTTVPVVAFEDLTELERSKLRDDLQIY